jgi:hypothetical protein
VDGGADQTNLDSQAWFWTERWQRMERETDEDIAAGRIVVCADAEELFRLLNLPKA